MLFLQIIGTLVAGFIIFIAVTIYQIKKLEIEVPDCEREEL